MSGTEQVDVCWVSYYYNTLMHIRTVLRAPGGSRSFHPHSIPVRCWRDLSYLLMRPWKLRHAELDIDRDSILTLVSLPGGP